MSSEQFRWFFYVAWLRWYLRRPPVLWRSRQSSGSLKVSFPCVDPSWPGLSSPQFLLSLAQMFVLLAIMEGFFSQLLWIIMVGDLPMCWLLPVGCCSLLHQPLGIGIMWCLCLPCCLPVLISLSTRCACSCAFITLNLEVHCGWFFGEQVPASLVYFFSLAFRACGWQSLVPHL